MLRTTTIILFLLPFAVTPVANAQFFGLGWHRNPPPQLPPANFPMTPTYDSACSMKKCVPLHKTYGHYRESWRRWPGTDSVYSRTTPGQPSQPSPPSDVDLPDSDVPDALNETKVVPRSKKTDPAAKEPEDATQPGIDVIPTPPFEDDLGPLDTDPSVDIPDDLVPETDLESDLSPTSPDADASPLDLDSSIPGDTDAESEDSSDLDSLFPEDDDAFNIDDLQGSVPRRIQSRDRRRSLSHYRPMQQQAIAQHRPPAGMMQGAPIPQQFVQQQGTVYVGQQPVYVAPNQIYYPQPQFVPPTQFYLPNPMPHATSTTSGPANLPQGVASDPAVRAVRQAAHYEAHGQSVPVVPAEDVVPAEEKAATSIVKRKPNPLRSRSARPIQSADVIFPTDAVQGQDQQPPASGSETQVFGSNPYR